MAPSLSSRNEAAELNRMLGEVIAELRAFRADTGRHEERIREMDSRQDCFAAEIAELRRAEDVRHAEVRAALADIRIQVRDLGEKMDNEVMPVIELGKALRQRGSGILIGVGLVATGLTAILVTYRDELLATLRLWFKG